MRASAAATLAAVGDAAASAVRSLVAALADSDMRERTNAARAIGRIGVNAAEATPPLTELLSAADESLVAAALESNRVGHSAKGGLATMWGKTTTIGTSTLSALVTRRPLVLRPIAEFFASLVGGVYPGIHRDSLQYSETPTVGSRQAHRQTRSECPHA
ncbi:MAG: HEAT repeat domain-containing protein [Planctomycetales bacterium]|nr:HEAT repeat domain-containing protein [Planctomycetales bacterium]